MVARRENRENGGLGEDPPGSTMTYQQVLRTWMFIQNSDGALSLAARLAKRENGGLGKDPPGIPMSDLTGPRTWGSGRFCLRKEAIRMLETVRN
jgi:hypothetical protein